MSTFDLNSGYGSQDPSRRFKGIVIVVALHAFLGWALVSGMARKGLNLIKKPLEAVVIQEVIIPPPEITPPVVSAAPVIAAVAAPPTAPVVIAPPPPPAPPAPPAPKGPVKVDMGIACPTQVPPEMPRKALQDGTEGVVKAQALIVGGSVKEVTILSGPRVFHSAVRSAMMQYKCTQNSGEILATQEFNFKLE